MTAPTLLPAGVTELVACAAYLFDTTPRDLLQPSRHRHIVRARQAVWWVMRFHGIPYPRIGRRFGKDHSTVHHGKKQAESLMERDYAYADKIATLVALRDGDFLRMKQAEGCKQHIPMLREREQPRSIVIWE